MLILSHFPHRMKHVRSFSVLELKALMKVLFITHSHLLVYIKKMIKSYLHFPLLKKMCLAAWQYQTWLISRVFFFYCRSFFQSVCVLGYCLLPTTIALIVCRIILLVEQSTLLFTTRFVITMVGFGWATFGKRVQSTVEIHEKLENVCHLLIIQYAMIDY